MNHFLSTGNAYLAYETTELVKNRSIVDIFNLTKERQNQLTHKDSHDVGALSQYNFIYDKVLQYIPPKSHDKIVNGNHRPNETCAHKAGQHDGFVNNCKSHLFTVSDAANLLPNQNTAILEYCPLGKTTVAFIIRKNPEIKLITEILEDAPYNLLIKLISQLLTELNNHKKMNALGGPDNIAIDVLELLYQLLFEPLLKHLNGIDHLVIIPHTVLHYLPFGALISKQGEPPEYLIDKFTISYAPSAKVLGKTMARKTFDSEDISLVYSCPSGQTPLVFSKNEIGQLSKIMPKANVLWYATPSDFLKCLSSSRMIHYSGHANRNGLCLHNFNNPASSSEELKWEYILQSGGSCRAELLTLCACETGIPMQDVFDNYAGIPASLLIAGGKRIISSLWPITELPSTVIMHKLYSELSQGIDAPTSLRLTQRWFKDYRNKKDIIQIIDQLGVGGRGDDFGEKLLSQQYYHPYFWAAFICSGCP